MIELHPDDPGDSVHIDILGQERGFVATGHGGDEAVHHSPWRDAVPPASTMDASSRIEVSCRVERQEMEAQEEPTEASLTLIVTRPSHDLHKHRLGDGERALVTDQLRQPMVDGTPGRPVVLDPRGRVGQDHPGAGVASSGTSAMALAPRMASASSRVMGCPARCRRARSTASVFVCTP